MKFTILIPHWKTGKMSAYSIAQLLKFKGKHNLDIVVIDNNAGDGSAHYLDPFLDHITIVDYPIDKMQSHGIAFDYVLPHIKTDYFITIESDSFPTQEGWLDAFEKLILIKIDTAGSVLQLSGGEYLHPCGTLYKTDNWWEAKKFCDEIPYDYYPNMAIKDGFDCHLMVHHSIRDKFLFEPEEYLDLAPKYKPYDPKYAESKRRWYEPTRGPFHNGMGAREEDIHTYGLRTIESDSDLIDLKYAKKLVRRIGYEPGQYFSYWHKLKNKNIAIIPTETKWINDIPGTQQLYTMNAFGFKHLWAGSAHLDMKGTSMNDVYELKHHEIENLYNSMPREYKI